MPLVTFCRWQQHIHFHQLSALNPWDEKTQTREAEV
jgi:hypothetical protein